MWCVWVLPQVVWGFVKSNAVVFTSGRVAFRKTHCRDAYLILRGFSLKTTTTESCVGVLILQIVDRYQAPSLILKVLFGIQYLTDRRQVVCVFVNGKRGFTSGCVCFVKPTTMVLLA